MKETVLGLTKDLNYYFCQETVSMGKGIDALCGVIRSNLSRDPLSNEVFIFLGKNRKQIKILRWESGTFILYTIKLYNGKYFRPEYNLESASFNMCWKEFLSLICNYKETRNRIKSIPY